jgi:carboxyl-terminal processing protease
VIAVVVIATAAVFTLGYWAGLGRTDPTGGGGDGLSVVRSAYEQIRDHAVHPPSGDELAQGAVEGMIKTLKQRSSDDYAAFYSPHDYQSVQELTTGQFSGIGVWLRKEGRSLRVVSVLPHTPAEKAGLASGDVITQIDGSKVSGLTNDQAVAKIKGQVGSKVLLEVDRAGNPLSFSIARRSIELPSSVDRMVSGDLGYIHLFQFAKGAGGQVHKDVADLLSKGAKGMILDLRDNGGGLFDEGINVAGDFIQNGPVVRYKARNQAEVVYKAGGNAFDNVPLVVLVNGGTASASEIVTGALQDRHRAVVVGTQTYGKGSVQQVVPLPDSAAMKMTTAAYYTPSGRSINGKGITPDVKVTAAATQKRRAIQILNGMVLSSNGAQG